MGIWGGMLSSAMYPLAERSYTPNESYKGVVGRIGSLGRKETSKSPIITGFFTVSAHISTVRFNLEFLSPCFHYRDPEYEKDPQGTVVVLPSGTRCDSFL